MSNLKLPTMTIENLKKIKPHGGKIGYKTDIMWNSDKTKVGIYHHNTLIAVLDKSTQHDLIVSVSNGGWNSKTTIDRLHRILRDNTNGYYGARIKDYTGYITCAQSHYTGGFMHELSSDFQSILVNAGAVSNLKSSETYYNGVH